jgi:hypothetical protein
MPQSYLLTKHPPHTLVVLLVTPLKSGEFIQLRDTRRGGAKSFHIPILIHGTRQLTKVLKAFSALLNLIKFSHSLFRAASRFQERL